MKLYPMYLKRGGTRKNQDLEVKSTIKRVEKWAAKLKSVVEAVTPSSSSSFIHPKIYFLSGNKDLTSNSFP